MELDKSKWQKVKFGDVVLEKKITVDARNSGLDRFIAGDHMNTEDLHLRRFGTIGDDYLGPAFHRKFEKGDILYGSRRTYLKKVAIADFSGITANTTFVLRENESLIVPGLIPFMMLSDSFTEHSVKNSKGSVNPYINYKDIAKYEFLVPPKNQQSELVELLWAADNVVEKHIEMLNILEICQTVYGLINYEDKTKKESNINAIIELNPGIPKDVKDPDMNVSFLAMADVSEDGKIINLQQRQLKEVRKGFTYFGEGDTLFAKITPCMENGKGALAKGLNNKIGFGSTEFHVLRPLKESDRLYCFYLSQMQLIRKQAEKLMVGSAGQKRVQADFFDYFTLHLPDEGKRITFGLIMDNFQTEKDKMKALKESDKQIQKQLINQIFN